MRRGVMEEEKVYGPFEVDQRIRAHSTYYAGRIGSRFYTELRDRKRILGSRCEECGKVYWPPRQTCGRCFSLLGEDRLVEIGPLGTLETYTTVRYSEPVHPRKAPFVYGIVRLDGADTGTAHFIGEADPGELRIGMRLEPVFEEDRKGNILDIRHFRPVR